MRRSRTRLAGAALSGLALCVALAITQAAAAPTCTGKALYIVAHQDDDLLFQSPDLLDEVQAGGCVRTVFLTAGDAGKAESYWQTREAGAQAAYAQMAGLANAWTTTQKSIAGRTLTIATPEDDERLSQVYMRLPDGGTDGKGFPLYDNQSLTELWAGVHPEPETASLTPITEIEAVDDSAKYTYAQLLATLTALIEEYEPGVIAAQNYEDKFFTGDHPDHTATAYFTREADAVYAGAHRINPFLGYDSAIQPANLAGPALEAKQLAFYVYGAYDTGACPSQIACAGTPYEKWLERQYVTGESAIPGASAGSAQTVASATQVTLDGSASFDPSKSPKALSYEWEQTSGPAATLSDPQAAQPSFLAPVGPASLSFTLVVDNGEAASLPATVTISVAAPVPPDNGGDDAGGNAGGEPPPSAVPTSRPPEVRVKRLRIVAGKRSRHVIRVVGSPRPTVRCLGRLPRGITCRARANGNVVVRSTRRTRKTGTFRPVVVATNSAGTVRKKLPINVKPR